MNCDAGGKRNLIELFNRLSGRLDEIDNALMRTNLVLLARFLVNVRAGKNGINLDSRGKRNRSLNCRTSSLSRFNDFKRALIELDVIVCFHPYSDDTISGIGHCIISVISKPT